MIAVIDTHVHFYPSFDLGLFLSTANKSLSNALELLRPTLQSGEGLLAVRKVLCLAERRDCHFFRALATGAITLPAGYGLERFEGDDSALGLRNSAGEMIYIVAGRQIISRERVEVLALTADLDITDGLPLGDVVASVIKDAVCVLCWSPGKWLFRRGRILKQIIKENIAKEILLGDTTMRPTIYPEPLIMRRARSNEFSVVAGSDPLPFAGEERWVGSYVTLLRNVSFDDRRPAQSVRKILRSSSANDFELVGRRCGIFDVAKRLVKNQQVRLH